MINYAKVRARGLRLFFLLLEDLGVRTLLLLEDLGVRKLLLEDLGVRTLLLLEDLGVRKLVRPSADC